MEYTFVSDIDLCKFTHCVDRHLEEGWSLQGGLSTCYLADLKMIQYSQALVKQNKGEK